jgi:putative ABC transport system ATP-binding protein
VVSVLAVDGVTKTHARAGFAVRAVRGAAFELRAGEVVALVGTSGSGKSTLLSIVLGWDRADAGTISFGGPLAAGPADPADRRWTDVAVLPQGLGLLDDLTVAENVLLPARALNRLGEFTARAQQLMHRLRVDHLVDRFPKQTSLGEQQRIGLARALALGPRLVLADEPTAHQDHGSTGVMLDLIAEEAERGACFLIATHDPTVTAAAHRVLRMRDGELGEEG